MSSSKSVQNGEHESDILPISKREEQPETPSIFNILDMPDEILINIILHLNARERVVLGSSSTKLNSLIFEDEKLLEYLDFSKDGHLTSVSDIKQYFTNEKSCKHILGVNLKNTCCITPGRMLNNFIGKAINIVDINILGMEFEDVWQLGAFLNPLLHLQRLSFDWPKTGGSSIPMCYKIFQHPFSRLKYLSVEMTTLDCVKVFIPSLRLCQELKKLRFVVKQVFSEEPSYSDSWGGEPKELRNLEVVEYCGPVVLQMKERFGSLLPNPEKWADFKLDSLEPQGFYLSLAYVCEELAGIKETAHFENADQENDSNLGWALVPEVLLKEVLQITRQDVPEEFCCLSTFMDSERCLLKIGEIERLLKDPAFEISYLYTNHPVHLGCDIHLVASAFQNLTELVLPAITRKQESLPMDSHFERRLNKKGDVVSEKQTQSLNMDSSFKMLVKNTPNLRHFTLGGYDSHENWDSEELYLIARWKYLETLRLRNIPIKDGTFLIIIGKHCKNLQHLELIDLGFHSQTHSYRKRLLLMLKNCQNLRYFSIEGAMVGELPELFTSLVSNIQLRRIRIKDCEDIYTPKDLTAAIEQLLCDFTQLTIFESDVDCTNSSYGPLLSDMKSLERNRPNLQIRVAERNRPNLQIRVARNQQLKARSREIKRDNILEALREDTPDVYPFPHLCTAQ